MKQIKLSLLVLTEIKVWKGAGSGRDYILSRSSPIKHKYVIILLCVFYKWEPKVTEPLKKSKNVKYIRPFNNLI